MSGVFKFPQRLAHTVVGASRPRAAGLLAALALGACPLEALAAPPAEAVAPPRAAPLAAPDGERAWRDADASPPGASAPPPEGSYRGALTASYVIAPFLALAVGGALSELEVSDQVAVLGGAGMFLAPAAIHVANGNAVAPLSFLGLVGSTALGTVVGGVAGHFIGSAGCDPAEDSDGCSFASLGGIIVGSLLGGVAGYTSFAIYDVTMNGAVPRDEPGADRASLQLWLNPLPRSERAASGSPFSGLQIGATLAL